MTENTQLPHHTRIMKNYVASKRGFNVPKFVLKYGYWNQGHKYLLKGRITLSDGSEMSVDYVHNIIRYLVSREPGHTTSAELALLLPLVGITPMNLHMTPDQAFKKDMSLVKQIVRNSNRYENGKKIFSFYPDSTTCRSVTLIQHEEDDTFWGLPEFPPTRDLLPSPQEQLDKMRR